MRHGFIASLFASLLAVPAAHAASEGMTAQYLFVRETNVDTGARAQIGFGLLDKGLTGSRGTPITNFFAVDLAVTQDFLLSIGLPLAGTLSGGDDDYGIGNIEVGAKYVVPLDRVQVGFGIDFLAPTGSSGAALGIFTRRYDRFLFAGDTFTFAPYVVLGYGAERLSLSFDAGVNNKIDPAATGDAQYDADIFYDLGAAYSFFRNLWLTLEFGGYTNTVSASNTGLFAGPGLRYQDDEMSFGVHLEAPFRSPQKNVIDFLVVFDFRVFLP